MMKPWLSIVLLVSVQVSATELSRFSAQKLQQAEKFQANQQWQKAIELLAPIESNRQYDLAVIKRALGVYYWQNGQVDLAIDSLEESLSVEQLDKKAQKETRRMLADLYFNQQHYSQALNHYYVLVYEVSVGKENSDLWLVIAKAHYQLQEWQKTLQSINKVIASQSKIEVEPLTIQLAARLQLKQWHASEKSLKQLLALQPENEQWWSQLVSVQLRNNDPASALTTLAVAKYNIVLSEQENRLLIQLLAKQGMPEQAARQLTQVTIKGDKLNQHIELARLWQQAKEWDRAIESWYSAAQIDPIYYMEQAQLLMHKNEYHLALEALNKYPKHSAQLLLLRAQVKYKLGRMDDALIDAEEAQKVEPTQNGESWLNYLKEKVHASRLSDTR